MSDFVTIANFVISILGGLGVFTLGAMFGAHLQEKYGDAYEEGKE